MIRGLSIIERFAPRGFLRCNKEEESGKTGDLRGYFETVTGYFGSDLGGCCANECESQLRPVNPRSSTP